MIAAVRVLRPDLVILSGDFVEHATPSEFEEAKEYLAQLPQPQIVVPGNHDLPFYNPLLRYRQGLRLYSRYIGDNPEPLYQDDEMIVTGSVTPRIFPLKTGRISRRQLETIRAATCSAPSKIVRILVTHHPLDLPGQFKRRQLARGALRAVEILSPCLDLMLAGHLHLSSIGATAVRYRRTRHSVVFAQAGTAVSRRNKGEPNSFNEVKVQSSQIAIRHHVWENSQHTFLPRKWENFRHSESGWAKVQETDQPEQVQL